jgi:hypothetical protein
MNIKLKDIIGRIEAWPAEAQEEAAELLLALEHEYAEPYELSPEDKAAIDRSLKEMREGRLATDERVSMVFGRDRRT